MSEIETAIIISAVALIISTISSIWDAYGNLNIRRVQKTLSKSVDAWEDKGSVGEQFGDFLLSKSDPDVPESPTNLECMASLVGKQIAGSFTAAAKGIVSGDVRTFRSVEKAFMEGIQTPESKALMEACDQFGVSRELGGVLLEVAQKHGYLDKLIKNNGGSESPGVQASW